MATIQRYQLTYVYALTEYNPTTCAQIDAGKWINTSTQTCVPPSGGTPAACGKVTSGTVTGQLGNGDCPGTTFTFAAICYTWKRHIDWQVTDQIASTWKAKDFNEPQQFPLTVPIVYPTSETTAAKGWDTSANGEWEQTLHASTDPKLDWSGNSVQETDPGPDNPANDKCWCKGSAIDQFYKITGGLWGPGLTGGDFGPQKDGTWGFDHVGFGFNAYRYYRLKQRAPCGTRLLQQMQFQATQVAGAAFTNYGAVNTLGSSFNYQTITSLRAGRKTSESYEPGTTMPRLICSKITWPSKLSDTFGASLVIDDPRPVAAALERIETLTGRPVTYEDPPLLDSAALSPMVIDKSGNPSLLVPKGGTLAMTLPADASAAQQIASVQSVVATYNARRTLATFVVQQDDIAHVLPREMANAAGVLVAVTPVLDTKVSLDAKPGAGLELLTDLCKAVASSSGQTVEIGTVPANLLNQMRTGLGFKNIPARLVLESVIAATDKQLSWRLLYDPGLKTYYLNIHDVRKVSRLP